MGEPTTTVLEMLIATLSELQKSPELTEADAQWLQRFAVHLVAEFRATKEQPVTPPTETALSEPSVDSLPHVEVWGAGPGGGSA